MRNLSKTFRSIKNPHRSPTATISAEPGLKHHADLLLPSSSSPSQIAVRNRRRPAPAWGVYMIVSTRLPRSYVGVTTNFSQRLKQHNGELKGGAKSSSAGRPWVLACTIQGFKDHSEACVFESRWKTISRKTPRKRQKEEQGSASVLRHREDALSKVKASVDCSSLSINWRICTF